MNANLVVAAFILAVLVVMFDDSYDRLRTFQGTKKVVGQIEFSLWFLVSGAAVLCVPCVLEYFGGLGIVGTVVGYIAAGLVVRWLFRAVTVAAFGVTREQIALAQADAAEVEED